MNERWVPCASNSSYSFIPILLLLYRCSNHALKMCTDKDIILRLIFDSFSLELVIFSEILTIEVNGTVGTLCTQLLLQLYSDSLATLQMS